MPTALITGITGQDGSYLAEFLLDKGYRVVGVVRRSSTTPYERIAHLVDRVELVSADLLDQTSLTDVMGDCKPDEIYNLAAQSFVADVVDAARAHRRVHRPRRDPHARGDEEGGARRRASTRPARARCSARSSSRRRRETTPFYPRSPVRRGQGVRPLDHGELPRELRAVRGVGHPVQPREPAPRPRVRDPQGHRRRRRASSSACATELRLGNLDVAPRLGLRRRLRGRDVAHAPAGRARRLRHRHRAHLVGAAALRGRRSRRRARLSRATSSQDQRFLRPAEVDLLVADSGEGARASWAGSRRSAFAELVEMMVDADLDAARAARRGSDQRALVTGGGGFVGQWLGRALLARRAGRSTRAGVGDPRRRAMLEPRPSAAPSMADHGRPRSRQDVAARSTSSRPDAVVHLAGIATCPAPPTRPAEAWST